MREILIKSENFENSSLDRKPEDWEVSKIEELAFISSGSTPNRSIAAYWQDGTIPWVKTGEINYTVIKSAEEKITQKALNETSVTVYPVGTVLVAMYGQGLTRGKVGILGIEATTNQACAAIIPKNENLIPSYLWFFRM
ncbi:restriction endonuclease subunit S [Allocoleopsis franciscana]|uniref:Type I restriction modification DNA specificity protein n=1 Tax=Allocoleopsis franciscana PCC 7113 TaxID=1173027 RepID=K9WFB8_9CYAN|nr:restriction endonuclease subunit S [Allocoleopsis franciscana]AFZ18918.1 type I restriction modification DNA specificity protein [Allocoleopsis franciscana PCC 7113]